MLEKLKNRIMSLSLVAVLIVSFSKSTPLFAAETIVLKQSIYTPAGHLYTSLTEEFAKRVAAVTDGRVKIQVYPGQSLCPAKEELVATHNGSIDMSSGVTSYFAGLVPLLNYSVLPWSATQTKETTNKAVMEMHPIIANAMKKFNVHLLYAYNVPGSNYCLVTRKEVHKPADLKGLKIRTAGGFSDKVAMNWGAGVISIPATEVYTVLQRGLADGTLMTKPSVKGFRLYEVAPYVTDFSMGMNGLVIAINKDKWNQIAITDQQAITGLISEFLDWMTETLLEYNKSIRSEWSSIGVHVYDPTPSELELWKAGAKSLWADYAKSSPDAGKIVDILMKNGAGVK